MPRTVYGKPQTNEQMIDLREHPVQPDGFILMQDERPENGDWIAQDDGTWFEVVPTLADAKNDKLKEINQWADAELRKVTSTYPQHEVVSWDKQETEARKFLADPNSHTPLLDQICQGRGIDKALLCQRIIEKANSYLSLTGSVVGRRQALEDQLDLAETVDQVNQIIP